MCGMPYVKIKCESCNLTLEKSWGATVWCAEALKRKSACPIPKKLLIEDEAPPWKCNNCNIKQ